jgi:hypothetical protein
MSADRMMFPDGLSRSSCRFRPGTTGEAAICRRLWLASCATIAHHPRGSRSNWEVPMAKARRTTHRSRSGKKLYAVRDKSGKFKDIQTYERSHRADLAKATKDEKKAAKARKAGKKKTARKAATKKAGVKKAVKKATRKKAPRRKATRKKAAKKR